MSEALAPAESNSNDPKLLMGTLRKMAEFAVEHGGNFTAADLPGHPIPSPDGRVHQYASRNVSGDTDRGARLDGKEAWFVIPDEEVTDEMTGGSLKCLGEGPAMRYGQIAELYLTNNVGDIEKYYSFNTDGRVIIRELDVKFGLDEEGYEKTNLESRGQPHQISDEALEHLYGLLDYIQPIGPSIAAE